VPTAIGAPFEGTDQRPKSVAIRGLAVETKT